MWEYFFWMDGFLVLLVYVVSVKKCENMYVCRLDVFEV